MTPQERLSSALKSDVGRLRDNNEDALAEDPGLGLLILADGMGGYNAGEVASGLAVAVVLEVMRREMPTLEQLDPSRFDAAGGLSSAAVLLGESLEAAHARIRQTALGRREYAGMGTTAVACLLHAGRLAVAHVGDSRLYRLRAGRFERLTRDHSVVEELIAGGRTPEEAGRLARRNILTRALGTDSTPQVDVREDPAEIGDLLLLCSDGLTDMLGDDAIATTLGDFKADLDEAARRLVEQANANGGRDNISVAIARVDALGTRRQGTVSATRDRAGAVVEALPENRPVGRLAAIFGRRKN